MGHRHIPNSFSMFGVNNQEDDSHHETEQSYLLMGGPVASENISSFCPANNMVTDGCQWNSVGRENDYASSSFSREIQQVPPVFSGSSRYPYAQPSAARNLYMPPESNPFHVHSSYYGRPAIHDVEGGLEDPTRDTGRGSFKRKSPVFSGPFVRGSTSRSHGEGSSSSSHPMLLEKPNTDYRSSSSGRIDLPQYRVSGLSIAGEDSLRNVRSRSRLDVEPNTLRSHQSSYPSQPYHSTTFPANPSGTVNLACLNADSTSQEWNPRPASAPTPGRAPISVINGSSYTPNRFVTGENPANVGGCWNNSISSGYPISSSQPFNNTPAQAARESHSIHSRRIISSFRTFPSYSHLGHEAAMSERMHLHPENSTSTYSRPLSTGGWNNSYRNVQSRITFERLQSVPSVVDAHDRMGSEASTMMDHSSLYNSSRSFFDQYRDMRLDVDNMSYEELLALGERIGNVSTGLSEDVMSNCLMEEVYSSTNKEGHCAICLEDYQKEDDIGRLKSCEHDYHVECIKKWLSMKSVCPICKAAAFKGSSSN